MALDATGTPTSPDNIPKYNTAVDPPSGKGFNAAMDAIQAALNTKGAAPDAPSGAKVWNEGTQEWDDPSGTPDGTKFLRDDGAWQTISTGPGQPVTTLPGSPTDTQQALLVDSLTAPTYAWLFQYEAGISDANKWIYLGGSPSRVGPWSQTSTVGTNNTWEDTGDRYTFPRAGIYLVEFSGRNASNPGATSAEIAVGVNTQSLVLQADNDEMNTGYTFGELTVAASDVLDSYHRDQDVTRRLTFSDIRVKITPIRVA